MEWQQKAEGVWWLTDTGTIQVDLYLPIFNYPDQTYFGHWVIYNKPSMEIINFNEPVTEEIFEDIQNTVQEIIDQS